MEIEELLEKLKNPDCDKCPSKEKCGYSESGSIRCILHDYSVIAISLLQNEIARFNEKIEAVSLAGYARGLSERGSTLEQIKEKEATRRADAIGLLETARSGRGGNAELP